jgi:type I restriction-modification system DNA methylase subunit
VKRHEASVCSVFKRVMDATGFYRNGKPTPGVYDFENLAQNSQIMEKFLKYGPVFNEKNLGAQAVFELSGSPCIYFKYLPVTEVSPANLARIHQIAWNHGLAPLFWIITDIEVLIFSCYSRPARKDSKDPSRHILARFQVTDEGLRQLNNYAGRIQIETGKFWQNKEIRKIDRDKRVDRSLLQDLTEVQAKLSAAGLVPNIARSLLGRSILAVYLQDKHILDQDFFKNQYKVGNFIELLDNKKKVYDFFSWLDEKFHQNCFPLKRSAGNKLISEKDTVRTEHLEIVKMMLDGRRIKRNIKQPWFYNFDIIPVEFISSIYEMFTANSDSNLAPHRETHYTPLNLVDLVTRNVFEHIQNDGNILDMSCGSGVFLVDAYRWLVGKKIAAGAKWTRKLVRETLYNQLYGLDVNPDALQITAFCLYLTALELDPDIRKDKDNVLNFEPLIGRHLIPVNSFDIFAPFNVQDPFKSKDFAAIIGNPPWTRCKDKGLAWDYCRQHHYPLARSDTPDQAFLWRIGRFAGDNTIIGLILHASPFFSHAAPALKAKKGLFSRFTTKMIVNLCELRQDGLFPSSTAPALVYIASGRRPEQEDTCFIARPERISYFKQHGIIEIIPDNLKEISVIQIAEDPDILKVASWSGQANIEIIHKLRKKFIPLEKFCDQLYCRKGLNRGQGFQTTGGNKEVPEFIGQPWLKSGALSQYMVDAAELPKLPPTLFYSPRNPGIYWSPLVITVRGLSYDGFKAAFCDKNVIYTEEYYGFSFSAAQETYAHYLNGILNSSLASYYLFLTASVWGIERDKIEPNDLMGLPIPPLQAVEQSKIDKVLQAEAAILAEMKKNRSIPEILKRKLDEAVFKLYDLTETEATMVLDLIQNSLDLKIYREKSASLNPPEEKELALYIETFGSIISPSKTFGGTIFNVPKCPLQIVRIAKKKAKSISIVKRDAVEPILEEIFEEIHPRLKAQFYPINHQKIETDANYYIVKSAERRHWTATTAYNDAQLFKSSEKLNKTATSLIGL